MKKVIKRSFVTVVLLCSIVSYANEINFNESSKVTDVSLNNVTEGSVLSIKDINGLILYKETIRINGNYSKKFDLTALPDGDYIFELDKEFEIEVIPFGVSLNIVVFDKKNESIIFKPLITTNNGVLSIHKTLLNTETINLKIFYENGDLVYSEKIENEQIFKKTYDFSTSLGGVYKVVMSNKETSFEKEFEI